MKTARSIQAKGIEPDIFVEPAKVESFSVSRVKESDLRGALINEGKDDKKSEKAKDGEAANDNEDAEAEDEKPQDYQLARALDLISGLSLYNQSANKAAQ